MQIMWTIMLLIHDSTSLLTHYKQYPNIPVKCPLTMSTFQFKNCHFSSKFNTFSPHVSLFRISRDGTLQLQQLNLLTNG